MPSKYETRRHESAHAIVALSLDIGLQEDALVFASDGDACTNVAPPPSPQPDESWCIRRAAVKLAGPIAMIRARRQEMEWGTLTSEHEYHADHNQAEQLLQKYWLDQHRAADYNVVQSQMDEAASMAIQCVLENEAAIVCVTEATEGHDQFSRQQVMNVIAAHQPLRTPSRRAWTKDTG